MFAKYLACAALLVGLLTGQGVAQYHHASTAYEGALRGEADLMRAEGQYQYWASLAARQYADACAQALQNGRDRIARQQEIQAMNRAQRNGKRSRLTTDQIILIAREAASKPLADGQLDRATGQLRWPASLREARYARLTSQLDTLFAARSTGSGADHAVTGSEIDRIGHELLDILKSNVNLYRKANDFIAAKKFVEGLICEVQSGNA